MSNREIAAKLYVSGNTVKTHSSRVIDNCTTTKNSESEPIFFRKKRLAPPYSHVTHWFAARYNLLNF
jgi:hypothetical protein